MKTMKTYLLWAALAVVAATAGCSKSTENDNGIQPAPDSDEIRAVATVLSVAGGTKDVYEGTDATGLRAWVMTTTRQGDFTDLDRPIEPQYPLYSRGPMIFGANPVTYDNSTMDVEGTTKLPADGSSLWAIAIHMTRDSYPPRSANGNSKVFYTTLDYNTEIMSSQPVEIKKGNGMSVAHFTFKHLLTKIDLKVKADDAEAADAWGKVVEAKLKLPNDASFYPCIYISGTTGKAPTGLYVSGDAGGFGPPPNSPWPVWDFMKRVSPFEVPLTVSADFSKQDIIATSLMAPLIAKADPQGDIFVEVTTETQTGATQVTKVPIALPAGDTQGYSYTICLNFKTTDIKAVAAMEPWIAGGTVDKEVK